jgi:transcriptional regulator with XRE-family HTH domain
MSRASLIFDSVPAPVLQSVTRLGENIRIARQRRRQTQADLAARMMVSLPTVRRIERGDPAVSIAIYFAALWALGLIQEVQQLATPESDRLAQALDLERLPSRVRRARRPL